jgi:hypothetical protein
MHLTQGFMKEMIVFRTMKSSAAIRRGSTASAGALPPAQVG